MLYYAGDENEDFSDSEQNRSSSDAVLINQYSSFYNNLFSLPPPAPPKLENSIRRHEK